jgi:hypothetical protein
VQIIIKLKWIVIATVLFWHIFAVAQSKVEIVEVVVTGYGKDVQAATLDALDNAIAQVSGTRIGVETSLELREKSKDGKSSITENFRQNVSKITKGIVKSYKVLQQTKDAKTGRMVIEISAQIPRYEASTQVNRLRMAVMPITILRSLATDQNALQFAERLSAGTEAYLTQTRRFAMLDRRARTVVDKEQSFIRTAEMPVEELVRTTAAIGTDYLVLTVVKDFSMNNETITRSNGKTVERLIMPVTIDVRVIDVSTRQIKFAQTFSHRGRLLVGKTLPAFANDLGQEIGETILNAIYPIAVIATNDGVLTLNQGGVTVKNGSQYKLVKLGPPMVDPYTNELLGRQEIDIGIVEITSVSSQMSIAKLISNSNQQLVAGDLLVRPIYGKEGGEVGAEIAPSIDSDIGGKKKSKDLDW